MKKIKKLFLNKNVISSLNKQELDQLKGGTILVTVSPTPTCDGGHTCSEYLCEEPPPKDTLIVPPGDYVTSDYEVETCEGC